MNFRTYVYEYQIKKIIQSESFTFAMY